MQKSTNYQKAAAAELNYFNGVAFDAKNNNYQVKSRSEKNKFYIVSKNGLELECECIGFSYHQQCSHCVAVRILQRTGLK